MPPVICVGNEATRETNNGAAAVRLSVSAQVGPILDAAECENLQVMMMGILRGCGRGDLLRLILVGECWGVRGWG